MLMSRMREISQSYKPATALPDDGAPAAMNTIATPSGGVKSSPSVMAGFGADWHAIGCRIASRGWLRAGLFD